MRKITFQADIDASKAQKDLDKLNKNIEKTAEKLSAQTDKRSGIEAAMEKANAAVDKTRENLERMQAELEAKKGTGVDTSALEERISGKKAELRESVREAENLGRQYIKADEEVQKLTADLEKQQAAAGKIEKQISRAYDPAKLKNAANSIQASLKGGFKTILKYGLGIRSIYILFRKLRSIVTEGIKEFAQYDSTTNKALTHIKNGASNLKASFVSLFVPLLKTIEPYLTKLMQALGKIIDYVGMFFAALRGQTTYQKAIAAQQDYADALKETGKEAQKTSKYLSGLDEIRTYDTQKEESSSSSSSGGGTITGVENIAIPDKVLNALSWVKEHLDDILRVALAVGAALLALKIGSSLATGIEAVNTLLSANWKLIAGLILLWGGLTLATHGFFDAWQNGITDTNLVEYLLGLAIAAGGVFLIFSALAPALAPIAVGILLIIGAIALFVLGLHDMVEAGEITDNGIKAITASLLVLAIALLALGAPVAAIVTVVVAAVAAIVLLIIKNWDTIKEYLKKAWKWIQEKFQKAVDWILKVFKPLIEFWILLATGILTVMKNMWNTLKSKITAAWNFIKNLWETIKMLLTGDFDGLKEKALGQIDTLKNGVVNKFNNIKDTIHGVIDNIKALFRGELNFPHIKMPHFDWSWTDLGVVKIPNISVSWYAKGGIVDSPTLFGAGEAGKEVIIPLERNTEWITKVANEIADILTDRLGSILRSYPLPAVANGSLIPPRIEVEIDGLDTIANKMDKMLERMNGSRGGVYNFNAYINRKTLFQEVIQEAKITQSTTGRNPFLLA